MVLVQCKKTVKFSRSFPQEDISNAQSQWSLSLQITNVTSRPWCSSENVLHWLQARHNTSLVSISSWSRPLSWWLIQSLIFTVQTFIASWVALDFWLETSAPICLTFPRIQLHLTNLCPTANQKWTVQLLQCAMTLDSPSQCWSRWGRRSNWLTPRLAAIQNISLK